MRNSRGREKCGYTGGERDHMSGFARHILLALLLAQAPAAALAEPKPYVLEGEKSSVGFAYRLNGHPARGVMPVRAAELWLDLQHLERSRITVSLDVRRAQAGMILATTAMRGASVLDARHHPEIRFESIRLRKTPDGAEIDGEITLRGVTRPMRLQARLYRQRGTAPSDLAHLSVLLTGALARTDFGASGYGAIVGDRIELRILVRIRARDPE